MTTSCSSHKYYSSNNQKPKESNVDIYNYKATSDNEENEFKLNLAYLFTIQINCPQCNGANILSWEIKKQRERFILGIKNDSRNISTSFCILFLLNEIKIGETGK